jgi:cupin fold WbuC family metalloprotein
VNIFSANFFDDLLCAAKTSDRLRASANIHQSFQDPCQKLFNAININSYICPHRHSLDPKSECLIAVKGMFALIVFSDEGAVQSITPFGSEKYAEKLFIPAGIELLAGNWHTVISLVEGAILFEAKAGPFDPKLAKEFPSWAPKEGSDHAQEYLANLRDRTLDSLCKMHPDLRAFF